MSSDQRTFKENVMDLVMDTFIACAKLPSDASGDEKVSSLITWLRYYCKKHGLDFYDLLTVGCAKYHNETKEGP